MTKNEQYGRLIAGAHCMGEDGLRDYHKVQAIKATRFIKMPVARLIAVRSILRPYRVFEQVTQGNED